MSLFPILSAAGAYHQAGVCRDILDFMVLQIPFGLSFVLLLSLSLGKRRLCGVLPQPLIARVEYYYNPVLYSSLPQIVRNPKDVHTLLIDVLSERLLLSKFCLPGQIALFTGLPGY